MTQSEMILPNCSPSEETLHQRLRYLSETIQRQLQEAESRHREQLESRIHHYIQLSTDLNHSSPHTKSSSLRRAASTLALTSENNRSIQSKQQCERVASCKTTKQKKEEEAEAECKKKFSAHPVPTQVKLPLYREMVEERDKKRKQGLEQRKSFLLSFQKPFSFQEREKKKQEPMDTLLKQVSQKTTVKNIQRSSPKQVKPPIDQECCMKNHIDTTQQVNNEKPKLRIADRNRMQKLAFLDEKPSFQPKINHQVPDFQQLHKTLQTESLRTSLGKHITKCQPFYLRTSARHARQSKPSPETSQIRSQSHLGRSKSYDALKSLSADTLPTYITDATRKRCMAIRTSMEMRDVKKQESADWLRKYQSKSEAMRKTVSLHAKLLDPHKSLREVYDEKLQHHREADRQKTKDYMKDLKDIKARVRERPLLFEQVKQRNAKARAEQAYKNELRKAGIKEQFVEEKGGAVTNDIHLIQIQG
ncbi:protein FAM161B [Corythoichthys intestinalis]|uniref:protein FAM161B n=1 Tax=Corythoichthys intestinalis TaxID=161448 RepID=UPI0025A5230C|nr:protein FAM161B [Corythoichthys intestinalis]XP_057715939.1 protein FAM161B [Corythoichthys intestinalis]